MHHDRKDILLSLKKAKGTLDKVLQMVEGDTHCIDIAHQINATMGLLRSANRELMRDHLNSCGMDAFSGTGNVSKADFIDELMRAFDMTNRK